MRWILTIWIGILSLYKWLIPASILWTVTFDFPEPYKDIFGHSIDRIFFQERFLPVLRYDVCSLVFCRILDICLKLNRADAKYHETDGSTNGHTLQTMHLHLLCRGSL